MKFRTILCLVFAGLAQMFAVESASAQSAIHGGGSNYFWFNVDTSDQSCSECAFYCFGIIPNYDLNYNGTPVRTIVQGQLASMLNAGHRSVKISVQYQRGATNTCSCSGFTDGAGNPVSSRGTLVDSANFPNTQAETNFTTFLQDIKAAAGSQNQHFEMVEVVFGALGVNLFRTWINYTEPPNWPAGMGDWGSFFDGVYAENKALVYRVRSDLLASGIPLFYLDFANEQGGSAYIDDNWGNFGWNIGEITRQYVYRLWRDYSTDNGVADTVGFGLVTGHCVNNDCNTNGQAYAANDAASHVQTLMWIYDQVGHRPVAWDLHSYYGNGGTAADYSGIYSEFDDVNSMLRYLGDNTSVILIGEAWDNDYTTGNALSDAHYADGRNIGALLQWPMENPVYQPNCWLGEHSPAITFTNYLNWFY